MRKLILTFVCICFLTTLVASANNYRYSTISWETSYDCTTCSETGTPVCIAFSGKVGVLGDGAVISDITGNTLSFNMNDGNTVSTTAYIAEKHSDFQQRIYTIYNFEFNYCYDYDDISEDGFYVNSDICYRSPATNMAQNNRCSRIECDGIIDIETYYQNSIRASVSVPVVIPAGVSTYTIPYVTSTNPMRVQCSFQRNVDNAPINRVYPDAYATTSGINQYSISLNPTTCVLTFNTLPGNVFTVNVKLNDGVNAVAVDFEVIVPVVESLAPQCQGTVIEGPNSITINMDIADWDSPAFSVDSLVTPANVAIGVALPNTFGSYVRVPIIYSIPASGWDTADTDGVLELRDSGGKTSQCTYSFPYRERLGVSIASDSVCPAGTGDTGCNGQSAYLTATVTGGIAPFTYTWSPFTFNASRVQAGVGVHTLKVSDGNGKIGFASYTVVANQLSLSCTQIRACSSSGCVTAANKLACNIGASCGAVLFITPSDSRTIAASGINQQFLVDPGVYTPRLVNAAGCAVTVSAPITIAARSPLSIAAAVTRAGIVNDIQCKGGSTSVTVTPSGGCPPYRITWASTSGAPVPASANSFGSAVVFSNIVAGGFTITVQDNISANPQGCTQSTSIVVTEPSTSASTPSYTVPQTTCNTAVSCNGGNNGRIDVSGATGTIVWTTKPAGQASVSGFNPSNLIAGVYAFQVTDNNGCPLTASGPISVTQPAPLSFTSSVSSYTCGNVQCKGSATGAITLTKVSGCDVASVQWSGGPSSPGSSLVASSLLPGTYNYLVTDVNGCTASGSATVADVSGSALAATYTSVNPGCTAGSSGSITVTPSNGCGTSTVTWSDGFTGASRTGLPARPYTYTVTDQNGCTVSNTVSLIAPSAPLAVSLSLQCGTLTATATGGVGSYTYSWKTNGTVNAAITGNTYPNAPVGTNTVTVSDAGSCQATSPTQTIRFPFIETGLADGTQYLPINGTWNTAAPTSAVLTSTIAGLSILRTNTYAFTTDTISGRFVTPSANTNNMVGLIVGYDTSNTFYYLLEWRGTVVTSTCTGTGTQAASGLYLLRVPRAATECEIAKRQNGVTLLQQSSIRTRWNAATTYNFVLANTQNYIMLDLNGVLVVSYWFQTADKAPGLINPGYFGIAAGSQTGLKLENVATDAQHVSCGNTGFTVTKRYTIDTGCSPSFSISWGDGITDSLPSAPVRLDGSNSAQVSFTHDYAYSGSYVGSFCMTTGAYTICDTFNILVAEYYVPLTNFDDGMTWTQNQYYAVTYQKSASTAISRPVKMELWNAANTQKILDVSSSSATTSQGVINYRPTTSITPAAYTLRLYWTQGEKQCPFYSSPVTMNIAAPAPVLST